MGEIKVPVQIDIGEFMNTVPVKIQLTSEEAQVPTYSKDGDAGADVYAISNPDREDGNWHIEPGQTVMVDLGIRIQLEPGWEMQVRSRSGLSKGGLVVANSPGTIDSGYRGPCKVLLLNTTNEELLGTGHFKRRTHIVKPGDRIAQFVLKRAPRASYQVVSSLDDSERGEGGFGSTGS